MSSNFVRVRKIDSITPHQNADSLELIQVGGWQVVVARGYWAVGDLCVYVPPDHVLPQELSDKLGVTKYLSNGRIKVMKLRGENSFGLVFHPDPDAIEDQDVADYYGITKYIPPVKFSAGDAEPDIFNLFKYTNIENLRNITRLFIKGEEVIVSEKIHGSLSSTALILNESMGKYEWFASSKEIRRKMDENSLYWWAYFNIPPLKELLTVISEVMDCKSVIAYGEVYGEGVQNFNYGVKGKAWAMFDISVDGNYFDSDLLYDMARTYKVPIAPLLYRGEYSLDKVKELSKGQSVGGQHIREGVVVKPIKERIDPKCGRVVLKYISDAYLNKQKEDYTDA